MALNPLVLNALKSLGVFGLGAAGTAAGSALFGESPEQRTTKRAEEEAVREAQFRRDLALEREKQKYALEQIRLQTGASESQSAALLAQLQGSNELQAKIALANLDPSLYASRAAVDQANWERSQELNRIAGMEQTRELTRRKIEGDTIAAWRGITEAQINRDATLGLGMMQLAYTAGMPNPNVLQGGAGSSQQSDPYNQFAAQLAAQNSALTALYQGVGLAQGAFAGALGQEATTKASAQLSMLAEALQRAQKDATLQASVAGYQSKLGGDTLYNLGQAKLGTELQSPQFLAQAGSAALAGENQLANQLGSTNLGVRAYQEQLRGDIAKNQAETLSSIASTRADNEGRLALGAQQFESGFNLAEQQFRQSSQLGEQQFRQAAQTKGQLALKQFGANQALAGTRAFA